MIMDLVNKYKQYGLKGFFIRGIKSMLRRLGIDYESYHFFSAEVEKNLLLNIYNSSVSINVKCLTYNDFLLGDCNVFTEKKLKLVKDRFCEEGYKAYGIIEDGKLVYSCWINDRELLTSSPYVRCELKESECLLLDAYCSPQVRGRGYHTKMNAYRCLTAVEMGKTRCITIVLKGNIPAMKVQQRCGLRIVFDYYILSMWGKTYTDFYKKKKKYDC